MRAVVRLPLIGWMDRPLHVEVVRVTRAPTPIFTTVRELTKPSIVVIALGANLVNLSVENGVRTSLKMADDATARGARCIWVGPQVRGVLRGLFKGAFYEMRFHR